MIVAEKEVSYSWNRFYVPDVYSFALLEGHCRRGHCAQRLSERPQKLSNILAAGQSKAVEDQRYCIMVDGPGDSLIVGQRSLQSKERASSGGCKSL